VIGGRFLHRMRQLFGALRPSVREDERAAAYGWLSPAECALFETMTVRDQEHGIIVCRRVAAAHGETDPDLLTAALLHDCGKGKVHLWHRIAHVALHAGAAGIGERMCDEHGSSWRRALWRLRYHPAIGARMAEAAGSSPEVVRLIRDQDVRPADPRLAALQAADDA
jgi:hypothetical protein